MCVLAALAFVSTFGFAFFIRFSNVLLCQSIAKLSINRECNDDDLENEGGILFCLIDFQLLQLLSKQFSRLSKIFEFEFEISIKCSEFTLICQFNHFLVFFIFPFVFGFVLSDLCN